MRIFTQFSGLLTGAVLAVSLGVFSTAGASDEVVATVGGKSITMSDLEESVRTELIAVENQRFEILEGGLQILIAEQLVEREAAEREVSVEELSKVEIFDKIAEPSDADRSRTPGSSQQDSHSARAGTPSAVRLDDAPRWRRWARRFVTVPTMLSAAAMAWALAPAWLLLAHGRDTITRQRARPTLRLVAVG